MDCTGCTEAPKPLASHYLPIFVDGDRCTRNDSFKRTIPAESLMYFGEERSLEAKPTFVSSR